MSREITHPGVVRSVEPGIVRVAIVANSACHSCRARQACGMSESAEKMVDVETSDYARYAAGDAVTVGAEQRMGARAVLLAYGGAFVVLMGVLIAAQSLGVNDGASALLSVAGVALYYFVVYLFRDRIKNTIHFTITKI
ncbi:SoxR reducing system RseC family protein [uncultured Alistipes sp.]|uniref:SoxR reducing system RseC family protein n=1 Tax=uncultured Alistipes sp. TaxID=538949 RepID=UPI0025D1B684|nr:SoxR reducing system RseC family protein [uncultured Alistipes sp.]